MFDMPKWCPSDVTTMVNNDRSVTHHPKGYIARTDETVHYFFLSDLVFFTLVLNVAFLFLALIFVGCSEIHHVSLEAHLPNPEICFV